MGRSDSSVLVKPFQEALIPWVLRDRGRPGGSYSKAPRYTDDGPVIPCRRLKGETARRMSCRQTAVAGR